MVSPEAATVSVFDHGLLYGDGSTLSEQGYQRFRKLCLEAGAALGGGGTGMDKPESENPRAASN